MTIKYATAACAAVLFCAGAVQANTISISMSNGVHSAQADFAFAETTLGNPQLTITLTNTMTQNADSRWLTGLYFDIAGSPTLTYHSSSADMITMPGGTQTPYNDHSIGQFWAFRDNIASSELPFSSGPYGLSAVGAGVFGSSDMLESGGPHPQPNGVKGGILGDFAGLAVPDGHQSTPFALGSVQFVFDLPDGFDVNNAMVSNVAFHFGSGFDEIILIPLPAPAAMGLVGLGGVILLRRRLYRRIAA